MHGRGGERGRHINAKEAAPFARRGFWRCGRSAWGGASQGSVTWLPCAVRRGVVFPFQWCTALQQTRANALTVQQRAG
jgi:hypothetical protein